MDQPQQTTLALISEARNALVEARTLSDFRKVMEVAAVAADAAKRAAKLMEAEGLASQIVAQAAEAAIEAAAVRIEAQAKAGEMIREMRARGDLAGRGNRTGRNQFSADHDGETPGATGNPPPTLPEIGVDDHHSSLWQRVADIPPEVRSAYIRHIQKVDGEPTTAGLRRFAAEPKPPKEDEATVEDAYTQVVRLIEAITRFNAQAISAHASGTRSKSQFQERINRLKDWAERANNVLH